jgi:hypothetical protein
MLTVSNIGGVQIIILVCSEILFFIIFTYSDFSGQFIELSKLHGEMVFAMNLVYIKVVDNSLI